MRTARATDEVWINVFLIFFRVHSSDTPRVKGSTQSYVVYFSFYDRITRGNDLLTFTSPPRVPINFPFYNDMLVSLKENIKFSAAEAIRNLGAIFKIFQQRLGDLLALTINVVTQLCKGILYLCEI